MKWYQVDSDTPNDPKIKRLIDHSREKGGKPRAAQDMGHLFLLWCYVANHGEGPPGHGITDDGKPLPLKDMAYECLFPDQAALVDFLDYLAQEDLIEAERWQQSLTVILPAMQRRADSYTRSKGRGPAGGSRGNAGGSGGKSARTTPDLPLQDKTTQDNTPEDQDLRGSADPPDLLAHAGEDQVDALVRTWNEHRKPGPAIGRISPQRRAAFSRAMRATPNLAEWRAVIAYLNGEPWCNAKGGGDHPNWRATLDWLAKPGKMAIYFDKAAAARPTVRADGTVGRNAAKGRTGVRPGEFAAALKGDDAIH